ncbi:MAG: phage baseplate protein [Armatimonadota bacterium]
MGLRQALFGNALNSVANCPNCQERLELSLSFSDLLKEAAPGPPKRLSLEGYELEFRLPCSHDLLGLPASLEAARAGLLGRIMLKAEYQGQEVEVSQLPGPISAALSQALAQADPLAVTQIEMSCPNCGHHFSALFDIVSFLWRELEHWALRTLGEVHRLASAYGWRESDILVLSPLRRQMYLQMVP